MSGMVLRPGSEMLEEIGKLLDDGVELCSNGDFSGGTELFRSAKTVCDELLKSVTYASSYIDLMIKIAEGTICMKTKYKEGK
jgi:hypothetical protein